MTTTAAHVQRAEHLAALVTELDQPSWIGETADALAAAEARGTGVLAEVAAERARQDTQWGQQNHPDGTGPQQWVTIGDLPSWSEDWRVDLPDLTTWARTRCQTAAADGTVTWQHILLEEVAEALAEDDPAALRTELVQVAAVALQWVQAIDRRTTPAEEETR